MGAHAQAQGAVLALAALQQLAEAHCESSQCDAAAPEVAHSAAVGRALTLPQDAPVPPLLDAPPHCD